MEKKAVVVRKDWLGWFERAAVKLPLVKAKVGYAKQRLCTLIFVSYIWSQAKVHRPTRIKLNRALANAA